MSPARLAGGSGGGGALPAGAGQLALAPVAFQLVGFDQVVAADFLRDQAFVVNRHQHGGSGDLERLGIDDYQAQHTPESVLPFRVPPPPDDFPEGCSVCGKPTIWEYRELPNSQRQSRCTECHDTLVWPK